MRVSAKEIEKEQSMVKKVEIYFRDLNPEAQRRLLKEFETTAEEENWDVFPIAEIEREMEN